MPITTFLNGRSPTRGVLWLALTERGRVLVREAVSDGGGGETQTYLPGPEIPCRIDALGGSEGEQADALSDLSTHVITLHADVEVSRDDDFEVIGVGRFEITAIRDHTGQAARMIEVTNAT